jgi:hypothetical protein
LAHVGFVLSSGDVIHSYACLALGFECDACPGRLVGELQILRLQLWMDVNSSAENINSGMGRNNPARIGTFVV